MSVNRTTVHSAGYQAQHSRTWRTNDRQAGHMTDWQRERMQPAAFTEDRVTPWSALRGASLGDWIVMLIGAAIIIVVVML